MGGGLNSEFPKIALILFGQSFHVKLTKYLMQSLYLALNMPYISFKFNIGTSSAFSLAKKKFVRPQNWGGGRRLGGGRYFEGIR